MEQPKPRGAEALSKKPRPLIVLSHGYTGYRSQFFYLAEHLASHGYVVASIDHTDSTNAHVDFANAPGGGFMSTLLNRARDQQAVLDSLTTEDSVWSTLIDAQAAAVIGFSMGGYGALNTVGGCYDFSPEFLAGFQLSGDQAKHVQSLLNSCNAGREKTDAAWRAAVAIAPWGGEQGVHAPEALQKLSLPILYIAGENDDVSGYEKGVAKLFKQTGSSDKAMLVFENARHNLAIHPAPQAAYDNDFDIGHYFEPAWSTETINRVTQHMILAFLDCHVKRQDAHCEMLPVREESSQTKGQDGTLTPPWPGFKERWATGLKYYRSQADQGD